MRRPEAIPHAVRHAAIFGTLDSLRQRNASSFEISYLEEGPDVWKLKFVRN